MDVLIFFSVLMFISIISGHFLWFLGAIFLLVLFSMNVFISDIQKGGSNAVPRSGYFYEEVSWWKALKIFLSGKGNEGSRNYRCDSKD